MALQKNKDFVELSNHSCHKANTLKSAKYKIRQVHEFCVHVTDGHFDISIVYNSIRGVKQHGTPETLTTQVSVFPHGSV